LHSVHSVTGARGYTAQEGNRRIKAKKLELPLIVINIPPYPCFVTGNNDV